MKTTISQTFNKILKTTQTSKLSTPLRELARNIEYKGENNAA